MGAAVARRGARGDLRQIVEPAPDRRVLLSLAAGVPALTGWRRNRNVRRLPWRRHQERVLSSSAELESKKYIGRQILRGTYTTSRRVAAALAITFLVSACGSSATKPSSTIGRALASKVIQAPSGYAIDTTPGANGQITAAFFAKFGGFKSPNDSGFVAGFKGNYVNNNTGEGISVTVIQFKSSAAAHAYLTATAKQTLSFAAPTYASYSPIAGAIRADATKMYAGDFDHAVAMARGKYYALFLYATTGPAPAPVEFRAWVDTQYSLLT